MKTNGYKHGVAPRKAAWRDWQWKKIRRKVMESGKRPGDCIVLYLAGEEDLDRACASRNSFAKYNMIAVECDSSTCAKLRESGVNTINARMAEVVCAWKGTPKIDVIVADYTCGIEVETNDLIHAMLFGLGISMNAVLSVNLQRGRDKKNKFKENFFGFGNLLNSKHRGLSFVECAGVILHSIAHTGVIVGEKRYRIDHEISYKIGSIIMDMNPEFNSYKSSQGNIYFDSVILKWPLGRPLNDYCDRKNLLHVQRKIAAAKAIRTQFMSGQRRAA